jgi:hypothetical protein
MKNVECYFRATAASSSDLCFYHTADKLVFSDSEEDLQ